MKKLKKIVFIDHEKWANDFYKYLCDKVDIAGETVFFKTGESAIEYLKTINKKDDFPDLILIDNDLTDMNCSEFAHRVRKIPAFDETHTALACLTGANRQAQNRSNYQAGFRYSFSKKVADFDIKQIATKILDEKAV